jgi:hypothetical protein
MLGHVGVRMREAMRASSRNIVRNDSSRERCGKMVFTATIFSKPCLPEMRAAHTVAMPPCAYG